ncbi:MAG: hypothetical protein OXC62_09590 [Aestuariivita sp.]|nr:hypothetical protein [Aestuariivita sp.]
MQASPHEHQLILAALRNINTSLTWDHHIFVGTDVENFTENVAEIDESEIHVHFINDKSTWPNIPKQEDGILLDIDGTSIKEDQNYQVSSSFALIILRSEIISL